jgi:uncharacterized membrane protein YfcA
VPTLLVHGVEVSVLGVAALGVIVGYVAGIFGIGGGFLTTPLLVVLFGIPLPVAIGTGLCQMVGTALVAFLRHRRARQGEVRFDLLILPGSLVGVELGTRILTALAAAGSLHVAGHSLPWANLVVEGGYVTMLLSVTWSTWRRDAGPVDTLRYLRPGPLARVGFGPRVDFPVIGLRAVSAPLVAYLGLALGVLSGLLGIGGGVALKPVMVNGFGFPIRQSVGTGILAIFVMSCVGTFSHALRGHVHLGMAVTLLVGATVSAQVGALASGRFSGRKLSLIHAGIILAACAAVLWDLVAKVR